MGTREGGGQKTRRVGDRTEVTGIPGQMFCESEQCNGKKDKRRRQLKFVLCS